MLKKANRFSFKGKLPKNTFNSQSFNLRYDTNGQELKVGVVVSKKVDKRAVERNRIKRVIMEAVGNILSPETKLTLIFYMKVEAAKSLTLPGEVEEVITKINANIN